MKSTVEAFKFIESEIDVELKTTFSNKKITDNKIKQNESSSVQPSNFSSHPNQPEYNIDERFSFPSNAYAHPATTLSSKVLNSRHSLPNNIHLDSTFENYSEISQINNYMDKCGSNILLDDTKLDSQEDLQDYQEKFSKPEASSTLQQNEFSFSSTDNEIRNPCSGPSETTNGLNNEDRLYSDDNSSRFQAVEAIYLEFKEEFKSIVNKILERYAQDSSGSAQSMDKAARQTITNKIYDDLSNTYGKLISD